MPAYQRLSGTPEPMHSWQLPNGMTLAGDSWGDPAGPLVLLQHGGGQTRHAWRGTGEHLGAAGYYAIAFDARGHGDSGWTRTGKYLVDEMVEDLKLLVEQLGSGAPVLVGASMGGATSLVAAGEHRLEAAGLVLVDIAARLEPEGVSKIRTFMAQNPEGFETLDDAADAISNYQPHRKRARNLDGLAKNLRIDHNGRYRWHWDPKFMSGDRDDRARTERLTACARQLTLPTLLVRGGLSDVLSEEGAQEFLALCPQAEYVNVGDAAHMVAGDRNDIFSTAVIDFLARTVPTGAVSGRQASSASVRPAGSRSNPS